jgi:hypothetical protein
MWTVWGMVAAGLLIAAVIGREHWVRWVAAWVAPFRPVHLQPLNPTDPQQEKHSR